MYKNFLHKTAHRTYAFVKMRVCCTNNHRPLTKKTTGYWNVKLRIKKYLQDPSKSCLSFTLSARITLFLMWLAFFLFNINCPTYISSVVLVIFKKYLEVSQPIVTYFLVGISRILSLMESYSGKKSFHSIPTLWLEKEFFYYSVHISEFIIPLLYDHNQKILTICIMKC